MPAIGFLRPASPLMAIAIAVTIPVPISLKIAIPAAVPTVVMVSPAAVSFPITGVKLATLIARSNPARAAIRRPGPIAVVPAIAPSIGVPVAIDPHVVRAGRSRPSVYHPGWRRGTDSDAYGKLSETRPSCQEHEREQSFLHTSRSCTGRAKSGIAGRPKGDPQGSMHILQIL